MEPKLPLFCSILYIQMKSFNYQPCGGEKLAEEDPGPIRSLHATELMGTEEFLQKNKNGYIFQHKNVPAQ